MRRAGSAPAHPRLKTRFKSILAAIAALASLSPASAAEPPVSEPPIPEAPSQERLIALEDALPPRLPDWVATEGRTPSTGAEGFVGTATIALSFDPKTGAAIVDDIRYSDPVLAPQDGVLRAALERLTASQAGFGQTLAQRSFVLRYQHRPSNPDLAEAPQDGRAESSVEVVPTPSRPVRVNQQATPVYPELARQIHAAARLKVLVYIGADGRAYKTAIAERQPTFLRLFDAAARQAAMQSTYTPATDASGRAVEGTALMPFDFSLAEGTRPATCQLRMAAGYPEDARRQGIEDRLWLAVPVDLEGRIDARRIAILERGQPNLTLFDASAREAAAQAACTPAQRDGTPVDGWGFVAVDYRLAPDTPPRPSLNATAPEEAVSGIVLGAHPEYPAAARRLGLQGRLTVHVTFDTASGVPLATRIVQRSSHQADVFDETVRRWAMSHRYRPAPRRETPQAPTLAVRFPLNFAMDNPPGTVHQPARCSLGGPATYPETARAQGREALMLVVVAVDENGRPRRADSRIVKRIPHDAAAFDASALDAAAGARCQAARYRGNGLADFALLEVPYRLMPDDAPPASP
ncbi:MAG: energy transducer TonB [Comamonas sp.]